VIFANVVSKKFMPVMIWLLLLGLACGSGPSLIGIAPPSGTIPITQEASDRLKQNFYQALQEANINHESQLRITNEEITSLFAKELSETGQIPLDNPQIWFTSGRIFMTGDVKPVGPLKFDSLIVATAVVNDGQLVVEVQEAQMGSLGFPDAILQSMTETVNEALVGILIDLEITRLEILEGEMFVLGVRRQL
jgi:hypothetical protein